MSLSNAVRKGNVNAVKKLLNNGASASQADKYGGTPLIIASGLGRADIVKLLLAKGANVNKANNNGNTPLYIASREGHPEVVKVLLAAPGIDVNKAGKDGATPLIIASWKDHAEVVKVLLNARGIKINKANNEGDTPLIAASYRGRIEIVKFLLAKGADVNKSGGKAGDTPMIIASWKGHTEIVKLLLANGADANKMDKDGETALYSASEEDHAGIVEILLKAGADPNKANNKGDTPLFVATRGGHVTSVRALLKAGADPNKAKPDGVTALHVASFNDKVDVVKELLAAKDIDPFKKNRDGKTALDQAKSESVRKLLRKAMGITTRWRNMNNEQRRGMKPILLKRMIAKGLKNGKNATFTEPIIYANYSYRTLKPVNNKNKNITSFGLVIDDKNNVKSILDLEGATRAMRNVRERANREGKRVEQPLPGIIFKNWSLVNFTSNEYFNAMKDLMKLSAVAKSARTRKNLESGRMNRIEANQRKTGRIANLRSTIRKSRRELNNLM
jgi:ankyrin repeat protein